MSGIEIKKIDANCTLFVFTNGSLTVAIRHGDIGKEICDALVNSTNKYMNPNGGVDSSIHIKMGQFYTDQVVSIHKAMEENACPVGQARIFIAKFDLKETDVPFVINTVGPIYTEAEKEHVTFMLASCYNSSLTLANIYQLTSIAFPAISCGANRFPPREAARVAIESVRQFSCNIKDVRFVLFDRPVYDAFLREWTKYAQQVNNETHTTNSLLSMTISTEPKPAGRYCVICKEQRLPIDRQLLCSTCSELTRSEIFSRFLARLRIAADISYNELVHECEVLKPILRSYPLFYTPIKTFDANIHKRDNVAEYYLNDYCTKNFHNSKPIAVVGDGNCLYNSLVRLVEAGGTTTLAAGTSALTPVELRARNIVELILNIRVYQAQYQHLSAVLGKFEQYATKEMVRDSTLVSAWDLLSLPTVLNISITCAYPCVNGEKDLEFIVLNNALFIPLVKDNNTSPKSAEGTEASSESIEIKLLFSHSHRPIINASPNNKKKWVPNHFVPLLGLK
ncbi:unnamed protein product [Adineta ricciae]|uniref:Macro domain-containing protein n=1 Tax=Adineta ricciae TaxID=249248 RepID=A0A814HM81_ADIRI|nr:unnamed protein product [Adineta ricciae]CAF1434662.1 unnamed protein product [Adineta ricciae]